MDSNLLNLLGIVVFLGVAFLLWMLLSSDSDSVNRKSRNIFYGPDVEPLPSKTAAEIDGMLGEDTIYQYLIDHGVRKSQILRNVYLPTDDDSDEKTEIDMLVISRKGILVLECKNYSGHIYGKSYRRYWVQYLGNRQTFRFYSPIFQNRAHIRHVRQLLGSSKTPIIPFTLVTRKGKWKISDLSPDDHFCVYTSFFDECSRLPSVNLSKQDIEALVELFKPYTNASDDVKTAHAKRIEQIQHRSAR